MHGFAGLVGIIATAVFAEETALQAWNEGRVEAGNTELTRTGFIGVQALGGLVCAVWAYITGLILWLVISRLTQLRIGRFEEAVGMNYSEHRVANPVEELTLAVQYASQGRHDEMRERMDAAGGDLTGLTESIRQLAEATERHQRKAKRFHEGLSNVNAQLLSKQRDGQTVAKECLKEIDEVSGKISNVLTFVEDSLKDDKALYILKDLSESIQLKIASIRDKFPQQQNLWRDISQTSDTLERVLASLRGARS